jgi:hypothetical protein
MSRSMPTRHRGRKQNQRAKREGAALLIVLFIVMMATSTALFAMQSSQFEQRAAGSIHQAVRAKYVAEAATISALALCYQNGAAGCTDIKRALENLTGDLRQKYGLPNYDAVNEVEPVYSLTQADFPVTETTNFRLDAIDNDRDLGSAVATAYEPGFMAVLEKWQVPNPGETRERYRMIISTYGEVAIGNVDSKEGRDDVRTSDKERFGHETISATRAYFDVR